MRDIFSILRNFFPAIYAEFLKLFLRKYTVYTATVLAFVAATAAFIVCIKQIILTVVALIVMPAWVVKAFLFFIPSNFIAVTAGIFSGKLCKSVYMIVDNKLKLANNAN